MCHLRYDIKECENVKCLNVGLHKNRHVVLREKYRQTSCLRDFCTEEGACKVEERGILGKRINSDSHWFDIYRSQN